MAKKKAASRAKKKAAPAKKAAPVKKAARKTTAAVKKRTTRAKTPKAAGKPTTILKHYSAGATLDELKKKFGLRGKSQLASAVLDALIAKGTMPPLAKKTKAAKGSKAVSVAVNKRGTIILPKEAVVDTFGAKTGQKYVVTKRGKRIILTASS